MFYEQHGYTDRSEDQKRKSEVEAKASGDLGFPVTAEYREVSKLNTVTFHNGLYGKLRVMMIVIFTVTLPTIKRSLSVPIVPD